SLAYDTACFFHYAAPHRALPSFPTRRSSDLVARALDRAPNLVGRHHRAARAVDANDDGANARVVGQLVDVLRDGAAAAHVHVDERHVDVLAIDDGAIDDHHADLPRGAEARELLARPELPNVGARAEQLARVLVHVAGVGLRVDELGRERLRGQKRPLVDERPHLVFFHAAVLGQVADQPAV